MTQEPTLPLLNKTVVLLGGIYAVPFMGQIMSDMGATVYKVEKPGGDDTRKWYPPSIGGESAYFLSINRGLESIVLNLKDKRGMDVLRTLVRTADVLVENLSPGSLEKLGMKCADMRKLNPKLVTCSVTGHARGTSKENDLGYDMVAQARMAAMSVTGNGEPTKIGFPVADTFTALYGVIGIMGLLNGLAEDGVGGHVEVDLDSCMLASMPTVVMNCLVSGEIPQRLGNAHPNIVPYQSFSGIDGKQFVVAVGNDRQWRILCAAMELPQLADNPKFATNESRVINRAELVSFLEQEFRKHPRDEWVALLESADIPTGPIRDMREVLDDPDTMAADMLISMEHKTAGTLWGVNTPIRFGTAKTAGERSQPPPLLGEHTNHILMTLGYTEDDIALLRQDSVVA